MPTTKDLVQGEIDGITWYEVPIAAFGASTRNGDPEGRTTMIGLGMAPPSDWSANRMITKPGECRHDEPGPFLPFDIAATFPGRVVGYHTGSFSDERVTEWMKANAGIPDELDLTFETYGTGIGEGRRFTVVARTVKNGRPAIVRRALDHSLPAKEAFARELPWLLRNCRRPEDETALGCAEHLATLLSSLTPTGVRRIEAWLERREANNNIKDELTIGGFFLPGTGVTKIVLNVSKAGVVRSEIRIQGDHVVKDDDTGIEIELRQELPATLVNGIKGESLARLIDVEWTRSITVRHPRGWDPKRKITSLRGVSPGVAFTLPDAGEPIDDEAATRHLVDYIEEGEHSWPIVTEVSAAAIPALRGFGRSQFLSLVEMMRASGTVDLAIFDRPGWKLRMRGSGIVVEACPDVPYADFLADVMGINVPD